MKRRKFLLLSILGLFISLVSVWYYKFKYVSIKELRLPSDFAEICNRNTLIKIGVRYRRLTGENNKEYLEELLPKDAEIHNTNLKIGLRTQMTEDFSSGKIILIDGWLISITEARQFALLSNSKSN